MAGLVVNSGGLGTLLKVSSAGTIIDCDSIDNIFQSVCWNPTAPAVQATSTTITNPDGSTSTVLAPATPANTDTTVPNFLCNFLDCDSSGNLELDGNNILWLGGLSIALLLFLKAVKIL
jgi:hypothetical protein